MSHKIVLFTTWFASNPRRVRVTLIGAALLAAVGLSPAAAVFAGQATGGVR